MKTEEEIRERYYQLYDKLLVCSTEFKQTKIIGALEILKWVLEEE